MIRSAVLALAAFGLFFFVIGEKRGTGQFKEVGTEYQRGNPHFLAPFRDVSRGPSGSTVRVFCDGQETALGMIFMSDGWVLTKANDLQGRITCRLRDGRTFDAKLVASHATHDIAVLKIAAQGLPKVDFRESKNVAVGQWIVCAAPADEPVGVGIVSVASRNVLPRSPSSDHGYLGVAVELADGALKITQVVTDTPAAKAGLKVNDVLVNIQGEALATADAFIDTMQKMKVGDTITVRIKRGPDDYQAKVTLVRRPQTTRGDFQNRMGTELSSRTTGYATILQHDAVIRPKDCGGPVVDLDGKVVAINICRAGRTESWAVPTEAFLPLLPDLMAGKSVRAK